MKLSRKLHRSYTWVIALVIVMTGFTSTLLFRNSLNSFLIKERDKEFEKISTEISEISQLSNGINPIYLQNYVQNKAINLTYYNFDMQVVSQFFGIERKESSDVNYVTKRYNLLNTKEEIQGYLDITYVENVFEYDQSTKEFLSGTIRNYALIFIFAIFIASLITIFLSQNITKPIIEIQKITRKIRQKEFDTNQERYNIFELDELANDINYLAKTLAKQEKLRRDYSHDIAHELRTPITNILLHLEGIRDEIIEADENNINHLLNEVKRLREMIDDLQISFNENEEMNTIDLEDLNLSKIVENIINSFTPLLLEKNITLESNIKDDTPIVTDYNKMTQILSNIVSNAIKAIDHSNGKIEIVHNSYPARDVIRISDNGIGMKKEELENIFDRFYRIDNVRNTKVSGHGLGLSITKNFIELLGYNLSVKSELNKGTEFILTIPK